MATAADKVMQMVEKELSKNPDVSNEKLYEKAKSVDDSIADLSLRQFHAKYPLQVKRRSAPKRAPAGSSGRKRKSRRKRRGEPDREAVRRTLLRFAKEISAAEDKAATIDLMADLDRVVDEVVEAVDGSR